jgi:secreted trypsin-like serine protease
MLLVLGGTFSEVRAIKRKPSQEISDHPEIVLVAARNSRTRLAGLSSGTLIAPHAVLTAAHGVAPFDTLAVTAPYVKGGPVRSAVKAVHIHPHYRDQPLENDLAVLILREPIRVGRKCPTLHAGDLLPLETKLAVVGRVDNGRISQTRLFRTDVTLVAYRGNTNVYGGNPQVVEEGDSGGPVFVHGKEQEIVAVVSGNVAASRANVPTDVYTPISRRNRDWILRQVPPSVDGKGAFGFATPRHGEAERGVSVVERN